MTTRTINPKYLCPHCFESYEFEDDARDCCYLPINQIFICPVCYGEFDTEDDALDCCPTDDVEPAVVRDELTIDMFSKDAA